MSDAPNVTPDIQFDSPWKSAIDLSFPAIKEHPFSQYNKEHRYSWEL
jgi:hypothetical protein